MAGFKSRSVLRQVMAGERNIASQSIEKFCRALRLKRDEAAYFRGLVLFNQSTSPEERQRLAHELLSSRRYREIHPLGEAQYNYFHHWYFVVIRELATIPGFRADPRWIAQCLKPAVSAREARQAIDELLRLGFLRKSENGELTSSGEWLATADEVVSAAIIGYHRSMIQLAGESIERFPRESRDISAQTFAVSKDTARHIKEKIQKFRKEIEALCANDVGVDCVYQLNFQLFPIAEAPKEVKP